MMKEVTVQASTIFRFFFDDRNGSADELLKNITLEDALENIAECGYKAEIKSVTDIGGDE